RQFLIGRILPKIAQGRPNNRPLLLQTIKLCGRIFPRRPRHANKSEITSVNLGTDRIDDSNCVAHVRCKRIPEALSLMRASYGGYFSFVFGMGDEYDFVTAVDSVNELCRERAVEISLPLQRLE